MKKLSLLCLLLLVALPMFAQDFQYTYEGQTLNYTITDTTKRTCKLKDGTIRDEAFRKGNNVSGDLIIPAFAIYKGVEYSVTEVGDHSFDGCSGLTSVVIPETVKTIGKSAFESCTGLKSVEIGSAVQTIGTSAFQCCDGLTELVIPNSVKEIGEYSFCGCNGLTSLVIGDSVQTIGYYAFSFCSGLTSVLLPNSVKEVDNHAFHFCDGLIKSAYPNTISDPFLNGFTIAYPCNDIVFENGVIYNKAQTCLYFAPLDLSGSYEIPPSVTEIGKYAFFGCDGMTSVVIGNSVKTICESSFSGCSGLTSLSLPNSVQTICSFAFSVCTGLTSVELSNSLQTISDYVFFNCAGLTSVIMGNAVKSIGDFAFSHCGALEEVILSPSVETIGDNSFMNDSKLASIIMGHSIKEIGYGAFYGCPATTVSITTPIPPNTSYDAFSSFSGKLRLQDAGDKSVMEAYKGDTYCWGRFKNYEDLIVPAMLEGNTKEIKGKVGETFQLTANVLSDFVTLPFIFWRSTNPEIATVDVNGLVTIHAEMSDNDDTVECKIIAETLYDNGPVIEVSVNSNTGDVDEIMVDETKIIDYEAPYEVYSVHGVWMGDSIDNLVAGFYIVRQGHSAVKIAVK